MRSIEPGISRFRVWSFGPSRNDGLWVEWAGETNPKNGVQEQTEPDSAAADQTRGREHAVARFQRAGAEPDAACQGIGADLLARHDGRPDRGRVRSRSRRRALRGEALRQGGARAAAAGP